jgi:hypothetical protein
MPKRPSRQVYLHAGIKLRGTKHSVLFAQGHVESALWWIISELHVSGLHPFTCITQVHNEAHVYPALACNPTQNRDREPSTLCPNTARRYRGLLRGTEAG